MHSVGKQVLFLLLVRVEVVRSKVVDVDAAVCMVIDRPVSFTVDHVEEASEKTAKSWSKCVRVHIVGQVVLLAQQYN